MNTDALTLGLAVGASYTAAFIGGLATRKGLHPWYAGLHKPTWTPSGRLIGSVWSVMYALMGVAAWLAWRAGGDVILIAIIFGAQLALNAGWSLIFFGIRRPDLAFVEILLLWLAVLTTTLFFAGSSIWGALLMLPYLAWVGFAGFLNFRIWRLNARVPEAPPHTASGQM